MSVSIERVSAIPSLCKSSAPAVALIPFVSIRLSGLLLLTAAVLKAVDTRDYDATLLQHGQIAFEAVLGSWALSGVAAGWCRRVLAVTFAVFAGASFWKLSHGASSCGCLGEVRTSPGLMAGIDLGFVGLLMLPEIVGRDTRTSKVEPRRTDARWRSVGVVALAFAAVLPNLLLLSGAARPAPGGFITQSGDAMLIHDPRTWTGERFPLLPYLVRQPDLTSGTWIVLLYNPNCGACHLELARLYDLAAKQPDQQIALVEVPRPGAKAAELPLLPHPNKPNLHPTFLPPQYEWQVLAPVMFVLKDGIVSHVRGGFALP